MPEPYEGIDSGRHIVFVQEILITYSHLFKDGSDLWFKSHVQHTISFIHHQVCCTFQVSFTRFQEIYQTPWCGNADLTTCKITEMCKTRLQSSA